MTVTLTIEQIALIGLGVLTLILTIAVIVQGRKLKKVLRGKSGADLEDSFKSIEKEYLEIIYIKHLNPDNS